MEMMPLQIVLDSRLNKLLLTAVWRDWGFRLNGKLVLYLENLCLTEKSRIFNPQPAPQSVHSNNKFIVKAAQTSLTLRPQ
jgi:hypothetical protein